MGSIQGHQGRGRAIAIPCMWQGKDLKDKPLSLSEVVNQQNAWARAAASAGLPLHAVDNTERKFYIHLTSQGRSKLPNRRALRTTILDRVAANVDVSMAATLKTVIAGTPC